MKMYTKGKSSREWAKGGDKGARRGHGGDRQGFYPTRGLPAVEHSHTAARIEHIARVAWGEREGGLGVRGRVATKRGFVSRAERQTKMIIAPGDSKATILHSSEIQCLHCEEERSEACYVHGGEGGGGGNNLSD
jgi:hypothetical protein